MTQTRWAVLGTANIAAKSFLPAMRAAGGRAVVVGSRDPDRARELGRRQRGRAGRRLRRGARRRRRRRGVHRAAEHRAHRLGGPRGRDGACGAVREAARRRHGRHRPVARRRSRRTHCCGRRSSFRSTRRPNSCVAGSSGSGACARSCPSSTSARLRPATSAGRPHLGGGALRDVGCYCVRLGAAAVRRRSRSRPRRARSSSTASTPRSRQCVDFPGEQRLVLSAGMRGAPSTYTRVIGDAGELRIANPFHPRPDSTVHAVVRRPRGGGVDGRPAARLPVRDRAHPRGASRRGEAAAPRRRPTRSAMRARSTSSPQRRAR